MQLPINPEYLHYLVDAGLLVFLWRAVRAMNKWYDILTNYPNHLHVNGTVVYPPGLEPGKVGHINGQQRPTT